MRTRYSATTALLSLTLIAAYSWLLYRVLPPNLPIHCNWHGIADRWAAKPWAIMVFPAIMLVLSVLMLGLPVWLPRQFAVPGLRRVFNYILCITIVLSGFVHLVILQSALHPSLDLTRLLVVGIFVFQFMMGLMLGSVPRNLWIGIRSPWTLASEEVWRSTHQLAGRLCLIAGGGGVVAVVLGAPVSICIGLLVIMNMVPVLHSLLHFRRLHGRGDNFDAMRQNALSRKSFP